MNNISSRNDLSFLLIWLVHLSLQSSKGRVYNVITWHWLLSKEGEFSMEKYLIAEPTTFEVKTKRTLCFVNSLGNPKESDIYVSPVKWNERRAKRVGRYKSGQILIGQIKREIEKGERREWVRHEPSRVPPVVFRVVDERMGRGR